MEPAETNRETQVRLGGGARAALLQIEGWSGQNKKTIVNRVVEWLGAVDQDTAGAIIGALPQSRRDDFARMVLEQLAHDDEAVGLGNITPRPSADEQRGSDDAKHSGDQPKKRPRRRAKEEPQRQ